jgi:ectoine hydroxylase-related dioxygenase (phytanoyl-CoA dioxygenase family)
MTTNDSRTLVETHSMNVPLTAEQKQRIEEDGVLFCKDFFDEGEVQRISVESDAVFRTDEYKCPRIEAFIEEHQSEHVTYLNSHQKHSFLDHLCTSPDSKLNRISQQLWPAGADFDQMFHQLSEPFKGQGISWHQDIDPESIPGQVFNFLFYPEGVTMQKGAVTYVPGSHKKGLLPPGDPYGELPSMVQVCPSPRDLIIMNCCVYHHVPRNVSTTRRYCINIRFRDRGVALEKLSVGVYRTGKFDYNEENRRKQGAAY